jgi:hypothetical protein
MVSSAVSNVERVRFDASSKFSSTKLDKVTDITVAIECHFSQEIVRNMKILAIYKVVLTCQFVNKVVDIKIVKYRNLPAYY